MVKQAVARTVDLDPIDRLEDKVRLLVDLVTELRAEQSKAADENARLRNEVATLRSKMVDVGKHLLRAGGAARRARCRPLAGGRHAAPARAPQPLTHPADA